MEPASPASELSREEVFFDALQNLHRRDTSKSSKSALFAPALLLHDQRNHLLQDQRSQHASTAEPEPISVPILSAPPTTRERATRSTRPIALHSQSTGLAARLEPYNNIALTHLSRLHATHLPGEASSSAWRNSELSSDQTAIAPSHAIEQIGHNPASIKLDNSQINSREADRYTGATEDRDVHPVLRTVSQFELRAAHDSPDEHLPGRQWASRRRHSRLASGMDENDLFLEVAEDGNSPHKAPSVTSLRDKRRSLPPMEFRALTSMDTRRPRTSGGGAAPVPARPGSRLAEIRSTLRYRTQEDNDSVASNSGLPDGITVRPRRNSRYSTADRQPSSPLSPPLRRTSDLRSPDMSIFGRQKPSGSRRPSMLASLQQSTEDESPAESSEHKQSLPESVSAESQTAPSTVWDELDDLKTRIKKLELTGRLPSTSGAAVATSVSPKLERPRTATTAPTTIDSSPKRDKSRVSEAADETISQLPASSNVATHPLLHAALAKAKPLLHPALYRSLEASAADALQLASLAGVTPAAAGAPSSAASVINGGSSVDRALRRKADSMCRNLTELTLALCDGKHEQSNLPASPIVVNNQVSTPASGRMSRMSLPRTETAMQAGGRPLSRLEARRSSILGVTADSPRSHVSPGRPIGEVPEEDDSSAQHSTFDRQRFVRSSSRLTSGRQRYEDISGDEDPTLRPASRVGSDFNFRSKRTLDTRNVPTQLAHRSFSLREALGNRRSSSQGADAQRELARVASLSSDIGRTRWARESTPPVLEEDIGEQESDASSQLQPHAQPQPRQSRLASFMASKVPSRRVFTDRAASLSKRSRQVTVE